MTIRSLVVLMLLPETRLTMTHRFSLNHCNEELHASTEYVENIGVARILAAKMRS